MADTYNRDVFKCGCGGIFKFTYTYNPLEGKTNDKKYREDCINEMRSMRIQKRGFT